MSRATFQFLFGKPRRGLGWKLWAGAATCLVAVACNQSSCGPRAPAPGPRAATPMRQVFDGQGSGLDFVPASGSKVELQGATSVGTWSSRSIDIRGQVVLDTKAAALNALFDHIQAARRDEHETLSLNLPVASAGPAVTASVSVPVMSLHGGSSGMDRDMQTALKAAEHPLIQYVFQRLQKVAPQWDAHGRQAELKLRIAGKLILAGMARPVSMELTVRRDSNRRFFAHAATDLLMTDFGVTPPVALFGLIKARDQVKVVFDLDLVLADDGARTPPVDRTRR